MCSLFVLKDEQASVTAGPWNVRDTAICSVFSLNIQTVCTLGCLFVLVCRLNTDTAISDFTQQPFPPERDPRQPARAHVALSPHPTSKGDSLSFPELALRTVSKLAPPPWPHLPETALLTCCPIVFSGDGWGAASAGAILHSIAAPSVDCVTLGYKRGFFSVCASCERSYLRGASWIGFQTAVVGCCATRYTPPLRPSPAQHSRLGVCRMRGPHCACSQALRQQGHLVPKQTLPSVELLALRLCMCVCVCMCACV